MMEGSATLRWERKLWHVAEVNVGRGMSRAWLSLAVKNDCEQWEDLSAGTGNPREDHGPCHEKTAMGDAVLVLRTHVSEWGMEDA